MNDEPNPLKYLDDNIFKRALFALYTTLTLTISQHTTIVEEIIHSRIAVCYSAVLIWYSGKWLADKLALALAHTHIRARSQWS